MYSKPPFEVRQGKLSGEVLLIVRRVAKQATYEFGYSVDQKTWTNVPSTMRTKTSVSGLTPGTTYWFRFRSVTRAGQSDWCSPVDFIVK